MASVGVGRNDLCPCGSGKKFKHCCLDGEAGRAPAGPARGAPAAAASRLNELRRAARALVAAGRVRDAEAPLKEIVRFMPANADAHYDLGAAYARCGRFVEAADSFRKAVELRPSFHQALAGLASALEYWKRDSELLSAYRKLSRNADAPRDKLVYLAKAQVMEERLEDAEATLRRLLVLSPDDGRTRMLLGQVLIDQRRFEEASGELSRAIDAVPAAFQKLAAARRMTEADRSLLARMEDKAAEPALDVEAKAMIRFGLGKAFDDLGEYEQAMRRYDAANALRAKSARFDRAAIVRRYDDLIARYDARALASAEHRRALRDEGDLPVFIVGMPRSGTTLAEQILSSHPSVAAGGELQFWRVRAFELPRFAAGAVDPAALSRGADDYFALLRGLGPTAKRVTDKAPLNFETLGLIRLALPAARIIHCRRNPVDTALSIYFTEFASSLGFAFDRGDIVFMYRQYERLMAHWRSVLPPDRFLELDYETLVADREAQTRRLVAFAGLEWDDACLAPERNARVVRTASVWQARQPIYATSVERWRRYEPWLGELRELLPPTERCAPSWDASASAGEARAAAIESRAAT
jgi:Flp pilus assembly protein TadD